MSSWGAKRRGYGPCFLALDFRSPGFLSQPTWERIAPSSPPLSPSPTVERRQMKGQQAALRLWPLKASFSPHSQPRNGVISQGKTRAQSFSDLPKVTQLIGSGSVCLSREGREEQRTERKEVRKEGKEGKEEGVVSGVLSLFSQPVSWLTSFPPSQEGQIIALVLNCCPSHLAPGMRHPVRGMCWQGLQWGVASWEGLFVPGQSRFKDSFMVPSGKCGTGGPSWHKARAGNGALRHSGELSPSCYLALRGRWGPQVERAQQGPTKTL